MSFVGRLKEMAWAHRKKLLEGMLLVALAGSMAYALGSFFPATRTCYDVWWHLKAGEWMFYNRAVPAEEFWSWTAAGAPWTAHEWLSELIFYAAYRVMGMRGLVLIGAACLAAVYLFLGAYLHRKGAARWLVWLTLIAITWGILPRFRARPDIFDFALLAATLYFLEGRKYPWLAVVSFLWANLHGGSLPALFLAAAPEAFSMLKTRQWREFLMLAGVLSLPVAINPAGISMYFYPFTITFNPIFRNNIQEWFSPQFTLSNWWAWLFLGAVMISILACRKKSFDLASVVAFAALGFSSARNISLFFVGGLGRAVGVAARDDFDFGSGISARFNVVLLGAALIAAVAMVPGGDISAPPERFPVEAVERLRPGEKLFNDYAWGGYLIWRGVPVFIDGRADIYAAEVFPDYLEASRPGEWRRVFGKYGVESVLISPNSELAAVLREALDWRVDYEDRAAVIFRKGD